MESSIILLALFGALILVIGIVLCFRDKIVRKLRSVLNFVFPEEEYPEARKLKFGMIRAITFVVGVVFLIFLISLFFSVIYPGFLVETNSGETGENKLTGPLGDLFNGIATPVLTFMTFCGVLVTIVMQQVQLKATLKDLISTRKEAEKSNEVLIKQLQNSEAQKFDNNFYSMLNFQSEIIDRIVGDKYDEGLDAIIGNLFKSDGFWLSYNYIFKNFTSINFGLLKYIKDHEISNLISEKDSIRYYSIVLATVPSDSIDVIFIAAINNFEYKNILKKYNFTIDINFNQGQIGHGVMKMIAENGIDLINKESNLINSMISLSNTSFFRFVTAEFGLKISEIVKN